MPTRPDLRGNLKPPTFELFCFFRFRVPRTGHTFLTDETVLDPQCPVGGAYVQAYVATFLLKSPPQTDSFGTRGWHGRGAWL